MTSEVRFYIDVSAERFLTYYQGAADNVTVTAHDGRRVRFPARVLRPYVTRGGIRGEFVLRFDSDHKFLAIERVGD